MYRVYGVQNFTAGKVRSLIASTTNEMEAKSVATDATLHWADYAYVKRAGSNKIFFIRRPDYDERPIDLMSLKSQALPVA